MSGRGRSKKTLEFFEACTKRGDKRYQWFVQNYGDKAWELDAMSSSLLRKRVGSAILSMIDQDAWGHAIRIEKAEIKSMQEFHQKWRASQ